MNNQFHSLIHTLPLHNYEFFRDCRRWLKKGRIVEYTWFNALLRFLNVQNNKLISSAPSPVSDLTVTQVDREPALEVTWSPVTPPGNCNLTYRVTWSFTNNTEAGSNTTSETLYIIHNLSYSTKYTVCVDSWAEGYNATQKCDFGTTISSSKYVTDNNRYRLRCLVIYMNQLIGKIFVPTLYVINYMWVIASHTIRLISSWEVLYARLRTILYVFGLYQTQTSHFPSPRCPFSPSTHSTSLPSVERLCTCKIERTG